MQNIFNKVIIFLFLLLFNSVNYAYCIDNNSTSEPQQRFQGYQVNFDYENYPDEREIAYQYLKKTLTFDEENPIDKSTIGIDLYDVDNDGDIEILCYFQNKGYCGSAGCPFEILKHKKNSNEYYSVLPNTPNTINSETSTLHVYAVTILNDLTLGAHNILIEYKWRKMSIWKWNGNYYKYASNVK